MYYFFFQFWLVLFLADAFEKLWGSCFLKSMGGNGTSIYFCNHLVIQKVSYSIEIKLLNKTSSKQLASLLFTIDCLFYTTKT